MKFPIILLFAGLLFIPSVQALSISDGLLLALPAKTIECVDIVLPRDGPASPGLEEYLITSDSVWGDVTELSVSTDENNSVTVPLCFSTFGHVEGECDSYTLVISIGSGDSRAYQGAVCLSSQVDVDYAPPGEVITDPLEQLNQEADVFDLGFRIGERVTLLLESYAFITLDVTTVGLSPAAGEVTLSPANPTTELVFTAVGKEIQATAQIRGCSSPWCTKTIQLTIPDEEEAFTVSLFPRSIDVKELAPVEFELTVRAPAGVEVSVLLPVGLEGGLDDQVLTAGEHVLSFTVTPTEGSSLYQLQALATSGGQLKHASAVLSTDELKTDAVRLATRVKQQAPETAEKVDSKLRGWFAAYDDLNYGEGLDQYGELQSDLNALVPDTSQQPDPDPLPNTGPEQPQIPVLPQPSAPEAGNDVLLLIAIGLAAVGLVGSVLFMRRKKPKSVDVMPLEP